MMSSGVQPGCGGRDGPVARSPSGGTAWDSRSMCRAPLTLQEAAEEAVAARLCEAAQRAAGSAVSKLTPLQELHTGGGADNGEGAGVLPADAAAALAAMAEALQLTFSELLGPLRAALAPLSLWPRGLATGTHWRCILN